MRSPLATTPLRFQVDSPLAALHGKSLPEVCAHGLRCEDIHHPSAHFVVHLLRVQFGAQHGRWHCDPAECRREAERLCVERLFNGAAEKGLWERRPPDLSTCLVFVAPSAHVRRIGEQWLMARSPKNRVGLFHDGCVWSLGASQQRIVAEAERFFLARHAGPAFRAQSIDIFYARLPD